MFDKILKKINNTNIKAISGMDATFLYGETPTSPMHIGAVAVIEGSLKFETFKAIIASRIHMIPKLRKRLLYVPMSIDYPYWVDDPNFDIDLHLNRIALPQPGSWKELRATASQIFSEPLDRNRPLWSFTFVEGLENIPQVPKGSVAVISKIHHVAIDGVAGAGILSLLFDMSPDVKDIPEPRPYKPEPLPNEISMMMKSSYSFATKPLKFPRLVSDAISATLKTGMLTRAKHMELPTAPFTAPATPFNGIISPRRKWNSALLEFDRVKAIKTTMGTTVNDVVLAICAGALRKYLVEKGKLPAKPLVAMVPVSTRKKDDGDSGNQIANILIQLATNMEDPIERLEMIHANAQREKAYQGAMGAKTLANMAEVIPFGIANQAARIYSRYKVAEMHKPVFNLTITNVPGNGLLILSSTSDAKSMPDIDVFNRYLLDSANELEAAVKTHGKKGTKKKSKAKPKAKSDALFAHIKKFIKANPDVIRPNSGLFQFNITGDVPSEWNVNLNKAPGVVRRGQAKEPDVALTVKDEHLLRIAKGELNIQTAFIQGRLKMNGDMAVAMRLAKILTLIPPLS